MDGQSNTGKTKRRNALRAAVLVLLFGMLFSFPFPIYAQTVYVKSERTVVPGGEPFGVRLKIDGALVYRVEEGSPAERAGALPGDVIVRVCGQRIGEASALQSALEKQKGRRIDMKILRGGRPARLTVERTRDGEPLGVSVRDTLSGIGTVSFYDPETRVFGGLGHGVCARSGGQLLPISGGTVAAVRLTSVAKGTPGHPGQLRGLFCPGSCGTVAENAPEGIFGEMNVLPDRKALTVAPPEEIEEGEAKILCTVDPSSGVRAYTVTIEKILSFDEKGKNFLLRVTDGDLIGQTGGIVQGMSGSPIIQNGKIVGAVTHVLLEDPQSGYGIYIGNMLKRSETAEKNRKAS